MKFPMLCMLVEPHLAIYGWTSNSSNCFDWDGVTCNLDVIVVKLELSKERLVGTLFESLSSLYHLRLFTLCQNLFEGKVHVVIFHLKCLEVLHLCSNEFVWGFRISLICFNGKPSFLFTIYLTSLGLTAIKWGMMWYISLLNWGMVCGYMIHSNLSFFLVVYFF